MGNQQGGAAGAENAIKMSAVPSKSVKTENLKSTADATQPTQTSNKSDEFIILGGKKMSVEKIQDSVKNYGILNLDKANLSTTPFPRDLALFLASLRNEEKKGKPLKEISLFENRLTQIPNVFFDMDAGKNPPLFGISFFWTFYFFIIFSKIRIHFRKS